MKQKWVHRMGALALCGALLGGTAALAAGVTYKTIQVLYNDISLVVDGVPVTPKDANGVEVEPFVYNGTTFVWNGDKAGSNWVEDVTGETKAKTLIYCLYGSTGEEDGEVPVDNPTSIPLTVNGQEINITVKYPVGTAESGS